MGSGNLWILSTQLFFSYAKSRGGKKKDAGGGGVKKISEKARNLRSRNDCARGAAVAARRTQAKAKAQAAGSYAKAAAAAAAGVCPQPGTGRQRWRRQTRQVQRPRSPGGRAPSELPRGSRGGSRAPLGSPVAEFLNFLGKLRGRHCRSGCGNPRRRRKRRTTRRSRHRRRKRRRRDTGRLRPLPGAFACNPAARGRRRPPPVTSRPLPPLPVSRRAGPAPPPQRPRVRPRAPIGRARASEGRRRAGSQ